MIGQKRLLAGQHFVRNDSQRELVRAAIHGMPLHLLGRHVIRRAHHDAALGHLLGHDFRYAEVCDLGVRALVDQYVRRFDIAMDDALFVCVVERGGGLPQNGKRVFTSDRLRVVQDFFERRTIHALHEDIGQPVFFGDVVNGDDIGMRQHPGGLSLTKQTFAQPFAFGFVGEIREPDGLDRDDPADRGILRTVNHPGRSTAELAQNPVSADLIHANAAILSGWQNSPRVLWAALAVGT